MQESYFDTIETLKKLGFKPDASFLFDDAALAYDLGNLFLSVHRVLNENFVEIISVSGVYSSQRTIAEIKIQLPPRVASIEQCAAFIAWGINKNFVPLVPTDWLEIGRKNFDTLPWVKGQKLYAERPRCLVERDWLKLALRDLRLLLPTLKESDLISFSFQNEIFSIRSTQKLIVMPATGKNWKSQYEITAAIFRNFPKRFNNKEIEVSVWKEYLYLGNCGYTINKTIEAGQT